MNNIDPYNTLCKLMDEIEDSTKDTNNARLILSGFIITLTSVIVGRQSTPLSSPGLWCASIAFVTAVMCIIGQLILNETGTHSTWVRLKNFLKDHPELQTTYSQAFRESINDMPDQRFVYNELISCIDGLVNISLMISLIAVLVGFISYFINHVI